MSVSSEVREYHEAIRSKFFASIDSLDAESFIQLFGGDESTFTFANNPAATGLEQIKGLCLGMFGMFDALRHELNGFYSVDESKLPLLLCLYFILL